MTWQKCRIGDVVRITHGFAFKGEHFSTSGNNVLLTPGNFRPEGGIKFDWGKQKFYGGEFPESYVLSKDDILLAMTDLTPGCAILGAPLKIRDSKYRYLHNQRLGKVVVQRPDLIHANYFYYYCCLPAFRNQVIGSKTGTTVSHTAPERIYRIEIALPPLPIQRRIAVILGALDDKIECNRRINQTLEAIADTFFKHWFLDSDNGWESKPLNEVATFLNGLALQKYPPKDGASLPVIKIAELHRGVTESSDRASANIPSQYIVGDGDILFSWSGSLDVCVWCNGRGALNQHLFKVTSANYPKWFYYQWVKHHLPEFRAIAAGKATTMGHIQREHLHQALVVIPPSETLQMMTNKMQPLLDQIINNNLESSTLTRTRDYLLPKLLSGEVEVEEGALQM
jgi:type I restriction enzyme, S subunit